MGRYRKVEVSTWTDEKFVTLSPMPPSGQGLWIYLLTGPHTSVIPGLCRAGRASLAEALKWEQEAFDKAFREAFDKGMAKADWRAQVLWLPKAIFYNPPASPNVVKGWVAELEFIPPCDLKTEAIESIKSFLSELGESFVNSFKTSRKSLSKPSVKPSRKPLPNQEQEQEQEIKREREEIDPNSRMDEWVKEVWDTYPSAHVGAKPEIGRIDMEFIVEAIIRDGYDLVLAGARNYRDAVSKWPPGDRRFIRPPTKFFSEAESDYLKDPAIWSKEERANGTRGTGSQASPSKVEQREQRSRQIIGNLEDLLFGHKPVGDDDSSPQAHGSSGRNHDAPDLAGTPIVLPPERH